MLNEYNSIRDTVSRYKIRLLSNKATKVMGERRAIENGVFIVFANCCGTIKTKGKFDVFMGKSFIASPLGGIICKSIHLKKEALLTATLNLRAASDSKLIYDL